MTRYRCVVDDATLYLTYLQTTDSFRTWSKVKYQGIVLPFLDMEWRARRVYKSSRNRVFSWTFKIIIESNLEHNEGSNGNIITSPKNSNLKTKEKNFMVGLLIRKITSSSKIHETALRAIYLKPEQAPANLAVKKSLDAFGPTKSIQVIQQTIKLNQ